MSKKEGVKKKILLHICCAGCGSYVSTLLRDDFDVTLFYFNPNIHSVEENERRLLDVRMIADKYNFALVVGDYEHDVWLKNISGLETEREKGPRCWLCYETRMETAARYALANGFDIFTTTLTVSPHKLADKILEIGQGIAMRGNISFLATDFKKNDGFRKSIELSRELGIYRQNYCGCEFSLR